MRSFAHAVAVLISACLLLPAAVGAQTPPLPTDPNFLTKVSESPCKLEPSDDAVTLQAQLVVQ